MLGSEWLVLVSKKVLFAILVIAYRVIFTSVVKGYVFGGIGLFVSDQH